MFLRPIQLAVMAVLFLGAGFGAAPQALASDLCVNPALRDLPILAEGRVVPLGVYATKVRKAMFPKNTCKELRPEALYCYLSQGRRAELESKGACKILFRAEHKDTRELLGLPGGDRTASVETVVAARDTLAQSYHMLQQNNKQEGGFGTELSNLLMHADKLTAIETGTDWKVLNESVNWVAYRDLTVLAAGTTTGGDPREATILSQASRLTPVEARNLGLEKIYERTHPFSVAVLFSLVGFILALLAINSAKFNVWTKVAIGLVLAIQIFGMALRVLISGRAPVTNMYETVMWVGFGTMLLSIFLDWRMKDKRILAAGFAGNSVCLFMMMFANRMLDNSIQPLVPVLRDNFWLSTHVTTITLSYACYALAWFVANFVLVRWLLGKRNVASIQKWNDVIRLSLQIGSVLLAAGIILGGVWADYSWGRFWGWDPKETWSLIALVIYAGILHGRYVGWFKDITFTAMGALGFMFVLMAWFGVNYILAVGLHSYGFSSGGSAFLGTIFISQIVLLAAVFMTNPASLKRQKA